MKLNSSIMNNKRNTSFKAQVVPTKNQFNYIFNGYPLLGKYIPQHCYGFLKYNKNEFTRYMLTVGCSVCSKLSIYDKVQKIGFFAHVDSASDLLRSLNKIKDGFLKRNMNPKNLFGVDVPGIYHPDDEKITKINRFFNELGLSIENIYQPRNSNNFDGEVLDLKDGQLYDLNTWSEDYRTYKNNLNQIIQTRLNNKSEDYSKAMQEFNTKYYNNVDVMSDYYTEI